MALNFEGGSGSWGLEPMEGEEPAARAETFAEEVERLRREQGMAYIPDNASDMEMLGDRSDYAVGMMSEDQMAEAEKRAPQGWTLQ